MSSGRDWQQQQRYRGGFDPEQCGDESAQDSSYQSRTAERHGQLSQGQESSAYNDPYPTGAPSGGEWSSSRQSQQQQSGEPQQYRQQQQDWPSSQSGQTGTGPGGMTSGAYGQGKDISREEEERESSGAMSGSQPPGAKPGISERMMGGAEKFTGKIFHDPSMSERGQQRESGQR